MEAPNLTQSTLALVSLCLSFLSTVVVQILKNKASKKDSGTSGTRKWVFWLIIAFAAVVGSSLWLFSQVHQGISKSERLANQLIEERKISELQQRRMRVALVKAAQTGLRETLHGMHHYILNDFHWPLRTPLNVDNIHKSIETQRGSLKDALERFSMHIELVGKVVGEEGKQQCTTAIDYANKVRDRILVPLEKKPPTEQVELIQLKRDLLVAFELLLKDENQKTSTSDSL